MSDNFTEKFATVPLFEGLDYKEISGLLRMAADVAVEGGETICRQGEMGDAFFVISAGSFEVLKSGESDHAVLARLENFSYFGEMSLVSNQPRSATVICTEAGRLKKFPVDEFNKLLDDGDATAYKVIRNMCRILAQRLKRLDDRLVS